MGFCDLSHKFHKLLTMYPCRFLSFNRGVVNLSLMPVVYYTDYAGLGSPTHSDVVLRT